MKCEWAAALQEILDQADKYSFSPLEEKLKGKMKVSVIEAKPSEVEHSDESEEQEEEAPVKEDELQLDDEQKKKLMELLGM